jgi:alpha-D-ribose 1-methylphosphonate 5-triphosphate diphosphatase PhnM
MGLKDWMEQNQVNIPDQQYDQMSGQFRQYVQSTRHLKDKEFLQFAFKEALATKSNNPKMLEIKQILDRANNQEIQLLADQIIALRKTFLG